MVVLNELPDSLLRLLSLIIHLDSVVRSEYAQMCGLFVVC